MSRCVLVAILLSSAPGIEAQLVRGRILDADSGAPIAGALLMLLDTTGTTVVHTVSSDSGRFELRPTKPGSYRLRAERIGYQSAGSEPLEVGTREVRYVEFRMGVNAVVLEPLRVTAAPRSLTLEQAGFYSRQRSGAGSFYTREDFDLKQPLVPSEILRGAPGVRLIPNGRSNIITFTRAAGSSFRGCSIRVFLDGILVGADAIDFVPVDAVEGLEVYRGSAQVPAQYGGADGACGVILLWSRRGGGTR